jgi:hypothetical protein
VHARRLLHTTGIVFLSLSAACGSGGARTAGPVVRDSAGVRIVENAAPAWGEGDAWRLSAEPALDVGVLDGPAEYQLGSVAGAVRLSDGTLVVGDGQGKNLRWFDHEGRHLRTVGREGDGPGEFGVVAWVAAVGDSVAVGDWSNLRVSVFAPDGSLVRSVSSGDPAGGFHAPTGYLPGGTLLLRAGAVRGSRAPDGPVRDSVRLFRLDPGGESAREIGRFAGAELFVHREGNATMIMQRPFGRAERVAVVPDGFFYGAADRYEVGRYGADGTLLRLIRRSQAPRAVTPADTERFRQEYLARASESSRTLQERVLERAAVPEVMPAYDDVLADRAGNLWVRDFRVVENDPSTWTVFDPDGRMLGGVTTPPRFRLTEVGADYVLGVWRAEMDVEHVRLYRLEKP